jgi:hypothetical protein
MKMYRRLVAADGTKSSGADAITVQIMAPYSLSNGSYSISLVTRLGSSLPLNGSFVPVCNPLEDLQGSVTGFIDGFSVAMWISI